ncbi:hypothetical protein HY989_00725 [Candidatus Micrarchaeota archaeon]|nr:hypothetical protein [Candidatus Micrarchaeota archaeon]
MEKKKGYDETVVRLTSHEVESPARYQTVASSNDPAFLFEKKSRVATKENVFVANSLNSGILACGIFFFFSQ